MPLIVFGPAIIDDAYITFRYAENIAAGKGFVFNSEDGPLLGTSTPLFTMLLAAGRLIGIPCPIWALFLSVLGAGAGYFFGILLVGHRRDAQAGSPRYQVGGIAWVLILGTLPEWIFVQQSGMETMFFIGISVAAIWAVVNERMNLAAALASLALLTRYDGMALAAIVLGWVIWRNWISRYEGKRPETPLAGLTGRTPLAGLAGSLAPVAIFAAIQLPWVFYALMTFGSYWPQSVAAKHIIHTRTFWSNLDAHLSYFSTGLHGMVGSLLHLHLLPLFALGAVLLLICRHMGLLLLLWGIASVLGFSYSRIMLQGWYMMPALFAFSWVAAWGLWRIFDSLYESAGSNSAKRRMAWVLPLAISAALLIPQLRFVLADRGNWPKMRIVREWAYFRAAEIIRQHGKPGQSVFVGEVGVFAYALPTFHIIDSSGINSRQVYEARLADVQQMQESGDPASVVDLGTVYYVKRILNEAKPDFIVSLDVILHLDKLRDDPVFQADYKLLEEIRVMPPRALRSPVVYIYQREK